MQPGAQVGPYKEPVEDPAAAHGIAETDGEEQKSIPGAEPTTRNSGSATLRAFKLPSIGAASAPSAEPGATVRRSRRAGACSNAMMNPRRSCQLIRPMLPVSVPSGTSESKHQQPEGLTLSAGYMGTNRIQQMHADELEMSGDKDGITSWHNGMAQRDKKLEDASYLTEMLTEKQRRSVILPNSRLKNCWDALIAVLVSYTAIMLPIQLCYDNVPQTLPPGLVAFDVFTDVIFITDIFLNFHVGYIDEAVVVTDKQLIRRKYLSRWFSIDVVGSFPGDTIFLIIEAARAGAEDESFGSQQASLVTLFKILKGPKLMRLGRLFKSLEKLEVCLSPSPETLYAASSRDLRQTHDLRLHRALPTSPTSSFCSSWSSS